MKVLFKLQYFHAKLVSKTIVITKLITSKSRFSETEYFEKYIF